MAMRWYIVHAYSNFERKVAELIKERAVAAGLGEQFEEVLVPMEEVVEMRRGRKVASERKFFPGYVLVKMELNDQTYHLIKSTPKVTGFLGTENKPIPITEEEAGRILQQVQEGVERPKPSVTFEIGEQVRVADGPFASFNGLVEEVDEERARLKVAVSIFGRPTPVELEYATGREALSCAGKQSKIGMKKIDGYIKLQVPAGQANPSPPIGPALGQRGVNIPEFCKQFNAATQKLEAGSPIPDGDHRLCRPLLHLRDEDAAGVVPPEEGGEDRQGIEGARPHRRRQRDAGAIAPDRRGQDEGSQRELDRAGDEDHCGLRPLDGPGGSGVVMSKPGKRFREA